MEVTMLHVVCTLLGLGFLSIINGQASSCALICDDRPSDPTLGQDLDQLVSSYNVSRSSDHTLSSLARKAATPRRGNSPQKSSANRVQAVRSGDTLRVCTTVCSDRQPSAREKSARAASYTWPLHFDGTNNTVDEGIAKSFNSPSELFVLLSSPYEVPNAPLKAAGHSTKKTSARHIQKSATTSKVHGAVSRGGHKLRRA